LIKPFDYFEPGTLDEALGLLHRYGDKARVLAGGTDLIVQMKQGKMVPDVVISLRRLGELDFLEMASEDPASRLRLGPTTSISTIATHPLIKGNYEILREAALAIGDVQIRNQATLGGNIANASPSADMIPALIALKAHLKLRSKENERTMLLESFYDGPFSTLLRPGEIIVEVTIPHRPQGGGAYLWMPKRTAVDETLVGVALWLSHDSEKKICQHAVVALNSVAPIPMRAKQAERFLEGKEFSHGHFQQAGELSAQEVFPRSRAEYRRTVVSVLVERGLEEVWRRIRQ
jgi:CO/xanthine dehydrogenase FAD-binding subunit